MNLFLVLGRLTTKNKMKTMIKDVLIIALNNVKTPSVSKEL
ncbi:hypothetical protein [Peribacillus sp. NPDC096540]